MDRWKHFAVTHRDHVVCNPLSLAKVDELIDLLDMESGMRVLDIACGKGEILCRLAERHAVHGIGVDLSPHFVGDARMKAVSRPLRGTLEFVEMDGAQYPAAPASFDLAMCLGASWVWGGHRGTLRALAAAVRPRGLVLVGEPYWIKDPPAAYLALTGHGQEVYGTHAANAAAGPELGLSLLYTLASSADDWDRYEALQWRASQRYAHSHPDDPDLPELLESQRRSQEAYLTYGREVLGWSLYLFQKHA